MVETDVQSRHLTKEFLLAGYAIFTVGNPDGQRFTFRVTKVQDRFDPTKDVFFVAYLAGPDNTSNYNFLGVLDPATGHIRLSQKSKATEKSLQTKVARWIVKEILFFGGTVPQGYYLNHAGRCGRCGRMLTVPESIERGIGPECYMAIAA